MHPTYKNIHNRFKINGINYDKESLFQLAYSFIKEGAAFEKEIGTFILDWIDDKDTICVTTSGTTGTPKRMTISKQNMVHSALATADFFNLEPGNTALHCLPTRYIAGKMMLVRTLIIGLELDLCNPATALDLSIGTKNYDFIALVPIQIPKKSSVLNQVKTVLIGGAKISETQKKVLLKCKTAIFETYGMTETITHIAAKNIREPYFRTLPNIAISTDARNCLVIDAQKICDTLLTTNDLVTIVNPNEFEWLGRFDNIINSGGIKFIPEKIEAKIAPFFKNNFFIASLPDEQLGEKIILVLEGEKTAIATQFMDQLEPFERPKEIYFFPKFIETNQKTKRKEIVAQLTKANLL